MLLLAIFESIGAVLYSERQMCTNNELCHLVATDFWTDFRFNSKHIHFVNGALTRGASHGASRSKLLLASKFIRDEKPPLETAGAQRVRARGPFG